MNKNITKKTTVTIGIPAYNEEGNISNLLDKILEQKNDKFIITKIIVVSDASLDNTNNIALSYKNKGVSLIINNARKGQIFAQNIIFKEAKSDLVVILEADTFPQNKQYLGNLIKPLLENKKIGFVQGYMKPLKAKTLMQKALEMQFNIFSEKILMKNPYRNPIPSGRGGRAFTKTVYNNLVWPASVPEDEYALIWCLSKKIKVAFEKSAICRFRLPQTFSDYLKEIQKNKSAQITINKYFPPNIVKDAMFTTHKEKLSIVLSFFIKSPILCSIYIFLRIRTNAQSKNKEFTDFWPTVQTTKANLKI